MLVENLPRQFRVTQLASFAGYLRKTLCRKLPPAKKCVTFCPFFNCVELPTTGNRGLLYICRFLVADDAGVDWFQAVSNMQNCPECARNLSQAGEQQRAELSLSLAWLCLSCLVLFLHSWIVSFSLCPFALIFNVVLQVHARMQLSWSYSKGKFVGV